jgi:hypothetical protein
VDGSGDTIKSLLNEEPPSSLATRSLLFTQHEQLSEAEIEKLAAKGDAWSEDQAVEETLRV